MSVALAPHQVGRPITLQVGNAICEIWPHIGGSIGRWSIGTQDMMRRASGYAVADNDPFGMASFPLLPYSNRIGDGVFEWRGVEHRIAVNTPNEPHALHGTGWLREWRVERHDDYSLLLHLRHEPDEQWPWAFSAWQEFVLAEQALTIRLSSQSLADADAPLAFGCHPYFDAQGAKLRFNAGLVWANGSDGLPAFSEAPTGEYDFTTTQPVSTRIIDNCYSEWSGKAVIAWANRPYSLMIEADFPAAVVYHPEGGDAFCFEPVPHINNALNMPDHPPQMPILSPSERHESEVRFIASV